MSRPLNPPSYRRALAELSGVALLWGFSYVLSAYLLDYFSPILLSLIRMVLTWMFLLTLLIRDRTLRRPTAREGLLLLASAAFGTLMQQPFYFAGLQLSSAANASLIYAAAPLAAVLLERGCLRTPLSAAKLAGGAIGLLGVAVIIGTDGAAVRSAVGDLYLALAMLGMTIGMLFTPAMARTMTVREINLFSGPAGIVLMLPAAAGEAAGGRAFADPDMAVLTLLLLLGAITAVSGFLWTRGVAAAGPGTAAMFLNVPPIVSLVVGHYLLGDPIRGTQLLGGAIVLAGVWVSNRRQPSKP
ncbi:membrane protein [Cohnella xylanilytica]|uniref:DMT family transporter n=1 Tax=Cohnella xylanilytica TaxID=557555 RepID=UPI001B03DDDA|nr:DMT family transporter [Cohnella xylanilytica]GIO15660.1 membrane protein [Cohnella xylanilytica]